MAAYSPGEAGSVAEQAKDVGVALLLFLAAAFVFTRATGTDAGDLL